MIRSVKTNKALLLTRVTEPGGMRRARLGGEQKTNRKKEMIFIAKTISFVKGKGSLNHNNRKFIASNIDEDRIEWNVTYISQSLEEAYRIQFGPAVDEYNSKQKRSDRKIENYLNKIKNSGNNEKVFYETVVQIGKRTDTGVLDENGELSHEAEEAKMVLDEYARTFQERNPNLYLFNAVLHMDEATPHLHLDYIPVAHGYKTGLGTHNSLTKGLQEMGIAPAVSKTDTETMHWQERERSFLTELCREHDIEIEVLGVDRDDYSIPEYKAAMRAKEEAEAELEILSQEKAEAENLISQSDNLLSEKAEILEEREEALADIDSRISEAEKKYNAETAKIDKILDFSNEVKGEVAAFRKEAKPVFISLPGEPECVKIPKASFEKLLARYQAVGTLQKLNADHSKAMAAKDSKINALKEEIETLKAEVKNHKLFLEAKGLVEAFKEFFRPKSISERLEKNQEKLKEQKETRTIEMVPKKNKNQGIAI